MIKKSLQKSNFTNILLRSFYKISPRAIEMFFIFCLFIGSLILIALFTSSQPSNNDKTPLNNEKKLPHSQENSSKRGTENAYNQEKIVKQNEKTIPPILKKEENKSKKEQTVLRPQFNNEKNLSSIKIKKICQSRGINYMIHFTKINNIENILKYGLMGRSDLNNRNINFLFNDHNRFDGIKNGICCSISFPNYKMFYSLRHRSSDEWVIIRLSPEILYRKKCSFFPYNAASNLVKRKEPYALEALFSDLPEKNIKRSDLNIPSYYTTDPQAEVIFHERIEPEYIIDICKNNNNNNMLHFKPKELNVRETGYFNQSSLSAVTDDTSENLFTYRRDYAFWQK